MKERSNAAKSVFRERDKVKARGTPCANNTPELLPEKLSAE